MNTLLDLNGRRGVVTGGANGLGFAIATALANAGAAITVIDLEGALATANLPDTWDSVALDLSRGDSLQAQRIVADKLGTVDIVIANAGIVPPWRSVAELDAGEWQKVMAINTWGVAATLGAFAASLGRSSNGAAVVMASINGYKAHPQQVLYTASKHAVIGIMRAAAPDLGKQGTRVNALAPGPVATDALKARIHSRQATGGPDLQTAIEEMGADTALGRIATTEDVANAALWLASDASAGLTGAVIPVEAGLA